MATTTGNYAPVNGLKMYYEIHGEGKPLVMIHGAFSAIESSFGKYLPELAKTRQVIGVELQAHGRTADIDRPLTTENFADDVAALLRYLNLESADVLGYSMGGFVALNVAVRTPELVRKLVVMSVSSKSEWCSSRDHGWTGGNEARNDAWLAVARGIYADRAAAGKFQHAVCQKDGDGPGK